MNFLEKIIEAIASEFDCVSNQALTARVEELEKQVAKLQHRPHRPVMVITIGKPVLK